MVSMVAPRRNRRIAPKPAKARLVREGSVLVISIPGAPKMTVAQFNEWLRKSRDREI